MIMLPLFLLRRCKKQIVAIHGILTRSSQLRRRMFTFGRMKTVVATPSVLITATLFSIRIMFTAPTSSIAVLIRPVNGTFGHMPDWSRVEFRTKGGRASGKFAAATRNTSQKFGDSLICLIAVSPRFHSLILSPKISARFVLRARFLPDYCYRARFFNIGPDFRPNSFPSPMSARIILRARFPPEFILRVRCPPDLYFGPFFVTENKSPIFGGTATFSDSRMAWHHHNLTLDSLGNSFHC